MVDVTPDPKPAMKPKRRYYAPSPLVKSAIRERAGERCEARIDPVCRGNGSQAHHVTRRSQGGTNEPANLLFVCLWCHEWIHRHPAEARERGLLAASTTGSRDSGSLQDSDGGAVGVER